MTSRTRASTENAPFKVYTSTKVPQQVHFPYRRKIAREKPTPQDALEPRQLTFLPEMMLKRGFVEDSEDEEEQHMSTEEEHSFEEDADMLQRRSKRTMKILRSAIKSSTRGAVRNEDDSKTDLLLSVESETELEQAKIARRKRQSTMTQLVEGRRPHPGDVEPEFKPANRRPRPTRGDAKGRARAKHKSVQQRTLTQMIPGLTPLGIVSDDDLDEEVGNLEIEIVNKDGKAPETVPPERIQPFERGDDTFEKAQDQLPLSETITYDRDDSSREYQPTQYIDAPARRARRSPRKTYQAATTHPSSPVQTPRKKPRTRFSLLATPERRRIVEIPSSQSPAVTPLSQEKTPNRSGRWPLHERTINASGPDVTPSKKQTVAFQIPSQDSPHLAEPPSEHIIMDSEDEGDDILGDDGDSIDYTMDADLAPPKRLAHDTVQGRGIGSETQAMVDEIDRACAIALDDEAWGEEASPIETEPLTTFSKPCSSMSNLRSKPEKAMSSSPSRKIKQDLSNNDSVDPNDVMPERSAMGMVTTPTGTNAQSVSEDDYLMPNDRISKSVSMKSKFGEALSPTLYQASNDLDGEPIQVPCSPPPGEEKSQYSTRSHSDKAEQQLQTEWKSYSQYQHGPPTSTARAVHNSDPFSYQATPFHQSTRVSRLQGYTPIDHSQATTADNSQPSPKRTHRKSPPWNGSTNTTPQRMQSLKTITSPVGPPSLFIPSSFPSPSGADDYDWNSPTLIKKESIDRERGPSALVRDVGSIEDFSIPPLPPVDDDEMFE